MSERKSALRRARKKCKTKRFWLQRCLRREQLQLHVRLLTAGRFSSNHHAVCITRRREACDLRSPISCVAATMATGSSLELLLILFFFCVPVAAAFSRAKYAMLYGGAHHIGAGQGAYS